MHCTDYRATRTSLWQTLAAVALGVVGLFLPTANTQMGTTCGAPKARPTHPACRPVEV